MAGIRQPQLNFITQSLVSRRYDLEIAYARFRYVLVGFNIGHIRRPLISCGGCACSGTMESLPQGPLKYAECTCTVCFACLAMFSPA